MKLPNFKITKVKCCYTCINSMHGDELIECKYNYGYRGKERIHYGISSIGKCKKYKQRKGIGAALNVSHGDNIAYKGMYPD